MLLLSYQYVTGYVAFRAEVQKSAKEGAMFKKKKVHWPIFSTYLSLAVPLPGYLRVI